MTSPLLQAAALTWIWDEATATNPARNVRDTRDPGVTRAAVRYIRDTRENA